MTMEKIISLIFFARRALTLNVYKDTWICWLIPFGKKNLDISYSIVIDLLPENYVTIPLA